MSTLYSLRPATDADEPFLYRLYALSRNDEMQRAGFGKEEVETFLRLQFGALREHYRAHFPDAVWSIVEVDERDAGLLAVIPMRDEIRLGEMILLPEFRRRGICTDVVQRWCAEGRRSGRPVRMHVERGNTAIDLYQRLGFVVIAELPAHRFLEWQPGRPARNSSV